MRAAIIDKPGEIRVGNVSDPTPRPDEFVIRVGGNTCKQGPRPWDAINRVPTLACLPTTSSYTLHQEQGLCHLIQ
jgi:hypothetical protein